MTNVLVSEVKNRGEPALSNDNPNKGGRFVKRKTRYAENPDSKSMG